MAHDPQDPLTYTWQEFNRFIAAATEADCTLLIKREKQGTKRLRILRRVHCRLNRVRAQRERAEIQAIGVPG